MDTNFEGIEKLFENEKCKKHLQKKNIHLSKLKSPEQFQEMKYFLDCGFNILIYGIGSKRTYINSFINSQL